MDNERTVVHFDLSTKQIKYRDILNKDFIELEIYAISDINPNRNRSHFTLSSMQDALPGVKNKPIVGFFENNDFTTHEGKADYDPQHDKEFWNTENGERILGWVRESDPVEIVEEKGLHWLKFRCMLCTTYCYKQVLRLLKDKRKKVSVEVDILNSKNIDGIEEIYKFSLNGVTILGSKRGKPVLEGIPDAHLTVLERIDEEDEFREQKRMLSFAYQQFENKVDADAQYNVVAEEPDPNEENTKKEVGQEKMDQAEIFATTIKVDKSKEAISDTPWGDVDKAELRRKVVEAENFKEIAKDIFLDLREGWEDGEVTKLKYPVMELKGDTAVYNRGALASAKAYAEQHNEEEVLNKLSKIYEELDLEDDEDTKQAAYTACEECKDDYCDECGCEDMAADDVVVTKVTPDVVIIDETPEVVNEEDTALEMDEDPTKVDLGIPECHNDDADKVVVDNRMPTELVPEEGMGVVVANDEETIKVQIVDEEGKKAEGADDVGDHSIWIEQLDALKAKCCEFETLISEKDAIIAEKDAHIEKCEGELEKCCDYSVIKEKLAAAEAKLEDYRCKELEACARGLMDGEQIKDEFYNEIIDKCCKGNYACEDDIKKDIAFAIYNSRQAKEKRFAAAIPTIEVGNEKAPRRSRPCSSEEGIKNYLGR